MPAVIAAILGWALAGAIPRILLGAGLALGTYAILSPLLDSFLSSVASSFGGLSGSIASIVSIAGAGEAINILASALVARMAIQSARVFIGRSS